MTRHTIQGLYEITKPKITLLVLVVSYCGMYLALGRAPDGELAFFTLLGLGLASSSSSALNNFIDRHIDVVMERTTERALPKGRLLPYQALIMGVICGLSSLAILSWKVNLLTAGLSSFALVFYIGVYTIWLKRHSEHCTVIGGIAGALPPVMGLTAVTDAITSTAVVLFVILFLWQPPHFWALALVRREEYRLAGIPMLPVVRGEAETKRQMLWYTVALVPSSFLPYFFGMSGSIYLGVAVVMNVMYLGWTVMFVRKTFDALESRRLFLFSILYISVIFTTMLLDCTIPSEIVL